MHQSQNQIPSLVKAKYPFVPLNILHHYDGFFDFWQTRHDVLGMIQSIVFVQLVETTNREQRKVTARRLL